MSKYQVTLFVEVTDEAALFTAAMDWLLEHGGYSKEAAREDLTEAGPEMALRVLLDPGLSVAGVEVDECCCEELDD